ncbi:MAG: alpha-amylase, partial [Chitinophagaceae bacterium]|nr:alpha-amylase [Chitinophagaceae bacterium]
MINKTIIQFFHWYYSPEGNLWEHAKNEAGHLSALGFTDVWLPPAYKSASGLHEPGYAVYDLYDLGEFDQKGSVRTRYGTKEEYLAAINALHEKGVNVIADVVLNHKIGGDEQQKVTVKKVDEENRNEFISEPHEVDAYTHFKFPGRKGKYSNYVWDWHSFSGISEDGQIAAIQNEYGSGWEDVPDNEHGNFDYLMGCDIEFRNPAVREELKRWGEWYVETTGVDGFRLDAVKHITANFFPEWLSHLNHKFQKNFYCIGEYWKNDIGALVNYADVTDGVIALFDVPLHFNFYHASHDGKNYDMRQIFDNTLVQTRPELAITFVDNHDTQPLQSLQSTVEFWFKPIAYALILLREQGVPCTFYPALYEAKYVDNKNGQEIYVELNAVRHLPALLTARKEFAYGPQNEYFDHPNVIGWTRNGTDQ